MPVLSKRTMQLLLPLSGRLRDVQHWKNALSFD